jgi:signal transduction histidine kinase
VDLDADGASRPFEVHAITILEDGSFWAGLGIEGLLVRIDPETGASQSYPLRVNGKLLKSEGIWSIRDARDGRLWIGHGRGLSRFDPSTERFEHWFESDGLPGSIVYSVEVDELGRAWLGTNRGLVRFDERSPDAARFRIYDTSDGIASMEFNRNASYRAPDGEMFFGGVVGMTSFRPEEIHDDQRIPSITLTRIEILGSSRRELLPQGIEELVLSHGDSPVTFEFASLTFTNVRRNRYRYRLEGFDEGWIETGSRRYARYTNVPAGRYVLRVIGSNQDGVWNETGVSLPVTVLPPFWETWWFRSLLLVMTGSLLYSGHRFRMAKAIEVERLRLRIASDLHDELSSELSGMSMMADLVRRGETLSPEGGERLDELRRKALEMADSMRDTAWGIHPEHDTAGAMIRRMRSTAEMLLSDIPFTFDVQGIDADAPLPMSERRNLHLIFKELLHNVVRHASASAVHILFERVPPDGLCLTVADDGRGFDPRATGDGDGLRNIRRRARRIGATFELTRAEDGGTRARVRLPWRG